MVEASGSISSSDDQESHTVLLDRMTSLTENRKHTRFSRTQMNQLNQRMFVSFRGRPDNRKCFSSQTNGTWNRPKVQPDSEAVVRVCMVEGVHQ